MTKRQSKKRALMASIISLILCISMLLGTTMAWFTDTVSNTGNRIVTGELDVKLLKYEGTDYTDISDGQGDIFATEGEAGERLNGILWEPGKTEVVLLQVANTGNLALNYNIILDVTNGDYDNVALEDVMHYAIIPNVAGCAVGDDNVAVYSGITGWQDIVSLAGVEIGKVPAGNTVAAPNGALTAGESDYFALAVHMNEDAGNEYQNQSIVIDVKVDAKQMPYEYDSFGNQYDADVDAEYYGTVYHVSTTGSDDNDGSKLAPFATVAKANEVISASDHEESVLVLIHGGTYFMSGDTVFSGAAAGGSDDSKVVYRAAGDGEVVFSGFIDIPVSTALSASGTTVGKLTSEKVQQELLKFDLSSYGVDYKQFDFSTNDAGEYDKKNAGGVFSLLLNGKEQLIASWPNYGEYEVIEEVVKATSGAIFKYNKSNIDTWSEESLKEAILRGYLGKNYREEWNGIASVDAEKQEITLKWSTEFAVAAGRNWRILNIAEEIDVPGEYCIDWQHSDLALYYYPPYELSSDDVLQLSVTKGASWICENTQNIVFDGIKFTGIRNSDKTQGVITVNNSDNIEIRNCTFTYNDGGANIVITGKNNIVEACGFYNCGAAGVFLFGGGDYSTLERQNNTVINNHFYNSGSSNQQNTGGAVTDSVTAYYTKATVGNTINNNLIHHIYGGVNIWLRGVEFDVSYNEISNGLRDLADYGLIYSGARPEQQGITINYNYLHDFGSLKDISSSVNAIYVDDWNSGHTANNNIIVANRNTATRGILSVGAYNTFKYNILANSFNGICEDSRANLVGADAKLTAFVNGISTISNALKAKYPYMLTLQEAAETGKVFPVINNVITDNIAYNAPYNIHENVIALGTIEDNMTVTDANGVFVDSENHDWRITSEYAAANNLNENIITEENFSMDQIGIQKDVWAISNPLDSFKQIYPKNGSTDVQPNDVTLNWEQALFADEYEYVVAKDAALTDVIASGTTPYEYVNLGDLEVGETYYWKITAVNTTRQLGASWDSEEVFSFTVDIEEPADKNQLVKAIQAATTAFGTIKDGEANKVGDYMIGTEAKLQALLDDANAINANVYATQNEVDEMTFKLTNAVNATSAYKYKAYVTLDTSDASKWQSTHANTTVAVEDGVMSATNGKAVVNYTDVIPNYNMVTFDVKANLDGGHLGIMWRNTKPTSTQVYNGCGYFFWITTQKIELQADGPDGKETIIAALSSNDYIKSDTWHNIRIETIDLQEGGGVEIVLYVDNQEVLRHVDTKFLLYGEGTLGLQNGGANLMVREASELPTFENISENADKSELVNAIALAAETFAEVKDGEEGKVGDYKIGTEAKLKELLDAANALNAKGSATQKAVDDMTAQLTNAVNGLSAYKYKGYVMLDTSDVDKWESTSKYMTPISVEDGILTVNGENLVLYNEVLPNYNMVTFDVNIDISAGGFLGIMTRDTRKETHYNVYDGHSYHFRIYKGEIRLYSYSVATGNRIIASCDSNDYLTSNEWHNIRVETINLEGGGVKNVLYVDDHEVLSHVDTTDLRYEEGDFGIQACDVNFMKVRTASSLPTFVN